MKYSPTRTGLLLFLLLSLSAHGLLFLNWERPIHDLSGNPENSALIHLSLFQPTQTESSAIHLTHNNKPHKQPTTILATTPSLNQPRTQARLEERPSPPPIEPPSRQTSPLPSNPSIQIRQPRQTKAATPGKSPPPPPVSQPIRITRSTDQNRPTESRPKPTQPTATLPSPEPQSTVSQEKSRAMVRRTLHGSLAENFQYPPIAIHNRWQGTVLLAFEVMPSGELKKIQIKKPSGHPVLDQDALETLSRIHRLKNITSSQIPSTLAMELPVIYQLQS